MIQLIKALYNSFYYTQFDIISLGNIYKIVGKPQYKIFRSLKGKNPKHP